jgi:hypothetical protein
MARKLKDNFLYTIDLTNKHVVSQTVSLKSYWKRNQIEQNPFPNPIAEWCLNLIQK